MTTPNTVAVALKYQSPSAPRVVATGKGQVGEAIIAKAKEHGIPIQQNPAVQSSGAGAGLHPAHGGAFEITE
jgi:flagellar biosynthesis protein